MNELEISLGTPRQINTKQIIIDDDIQRGVNDRKPQFDRIMKNFDPDRVDAITIAEIDGKYYCTDGQMRIAVLKAQNGGKDLTVPCLVKSGKKKPEAADMFADQDENTKRVTMGDKLYTRANGGEKEDEKNFIETNARHGFRTDNRGKTNKNLIMVNSGRALFEEYHLFRDVDKYEEYLYVLENAFKPKEPCRAHKCLIKGLGLFMRVYDGKYDVDLLISQLKKSSAEEIVRKGSASAGQGYRKYSEAILEVYNYNLRGKNKSKFLKDIL